MKYSRSALSIAGSDPTAGAGIQADIKTMSAIGVYCATAITAVTAQDSDHVRAVHALPPDLVAEQIDSAFGEFGISGVKVGMVGNRAIVDVVARSLERWIPNAGVVLDPVMTATSGASFMDTDALSALMERLLPHCSIVTPNIPECNILLGAEVAAFAEMPEAAGELSKSLSIRAGRPVSVYLKGGHLNTGNSGDAKSFGDVFFNAESGRVSRLYGAWTETRNLHGTGCTLSSALTAFLVLGYGQDKSAAMAKAYLEKLIAASSKSTLSNGNGPLLHFLP